MYCVFLVFFFWPTFDIIADVPTFMQCNVYERKNDEKNVIALEKNLTCVD